MGLFIDGQAASTRSARVSRLPAVGLGLLASAVLATSAVAQATAVSGLRPAAVLHRASVIPSVSQPSDWTVRHVAWAGRGECRVLLEVPADVRLNGRDSDERPAQVAVDWIAALKELGVAGKPDMRTLQIMRIDPDNGRPRFYTDYAYPRGPYDRPFRWYDGAIPYEFPEVLAPTSYTDGERRRLITERAGHLYNAVGDWREGRLVWSHTRQGDQPSYYAAYFDLMEADKAPPESAPRGWIGDGMPRTDRWGKTTTGQDGTQIAVDDWDGDGLPDIVYGEQYGQILVKMNRGTRERPEFGPERMVFDSEGMPVDAGVHAAPLVIDWDGDGARDLLIGTYQNRVAFYRNISTDENRKLAYRGFLRDKTGEFLALPVKPVAVKAEGVFKEDYYPSMAAADWDGDGQVDLLAGGYITGRVYFYRNTGARDDDGLPVLELVEPLEADGDPINVRDWCAAPTVADFNGDGLLDLVVGSYTWDPESDERPSFLRYYVNVGTANEPVLQERPLPVRGQVSRLRLPKPRAVDFNHDGLIDLIASAGANVILYPNVGTASEPLFDIEQTPVRTAWGNAKLIDTHQVLDWNDDGWPDLVNGYTIHLNAGIGKPYFWDRTERILPDGVHIDHPVKLGDGHFYTYLRDMDGDGRLDVLFGDWHGHVWLHRNHSDGNTNAFDVDGQKLLTVDGNPIKVGPQNGDFEGDFQALQGARTTLVAGDFNGEGLEDLVVGDTYGLVRYFQNAGPAAAPRFAEPILVTDLKSRVWVEKADWNGDGRLDVVASLSSHRVLVCLNVGTSDQVKFEEPVPLDLHVKGPITTVVDLNRDGDEDLLINGTQGTTFVERSFLDHGYAPAHVLKVERRPGSDAK